VIINLGNQPVDSFQLSLDQSPLERGRYRFENLLGELDQRLSVDGNGGFTLESNIRLQPFQTIILKLD